MPDDWKDQHRRPGRDLLRRRGLAGHGARPRLAVGLAAEVPARVRPVRQPAPGAADAGHPLAAGRPPGPAAGPARSTCGSCARTPRASTQRGRAHVRGHRARDRDAADGDVAPRRRPRAALRLRAGHASRPRRKLTSATKSNGIAITMPYWDERVDAMARPTRRSASTGSTSTSSPRTSCSGRSSSTWWWRATCSATSCPTWGRPAPAPSASRPRPTSTRRGMAQPVRAGARLGARHRRQGAWPTRSARSGRPR
jgi:hypothetical protein